MESLLIMLRLGFAVSKDIVPCDIVRFHYILDLRLKMGMGYEAVKELYKRFGEVCRVLWYSCGLEGLKVRAIGAIVG